MKRDGHIQNVVAWWLVGLMVFVVAGWFLASEYEMSLLGMSTAFLGIVAAGSPLLIYGTVRYDRKIVSALSSVLLLIVFSGTAAPLSYLVAGLGFPLWDGTLYQWDQALGLDWRSYLAWTNEHPLIGLIFTLAYRSLVSQMVVICVVLAFMGRYFELRAFTLAVVVSGVMCVLLSALMPALAMYVHLGLKPQDFPNLSPAAAYVHVDHIFGLRDGSFRLLDLNKAEGIITFPSYHASLAIIFLAGFWTVPLLRWPGVILNLVVVAATPIDGGHYFVDVGAGIAIAGLSLMIAHHAHRLLSWEGVMQVVAASPFRSFDRSPKHVRG